MNRRRQETDRNEQEEAEDRREWARGGRRQTGMSRRRQETDKNEQEEAGDRQEWVGGGRRQFRQE